jgi:hypothetical protein
MKAACFAATGVLLQMVLTACFILVARTNSPEPGKTVVTTIAVVTMLTLLLLSARLLPLKTQTLVCAIWALGYALGFQVLGGLFFPGLLKDVEGWSTYYLLSVARVAGSLFTIYLLGALSIHFSCAVIARWRSNSR